MTAYHSVVTECPVTPDPLITLLTGYRLGSALLHSAKASM